MKSLFQNSDHKIILVLATIHFCIYEFSGYFLLTWKDSNMKNMIVKLKVLGNALIAVDSHLIKFLSLAKWLSRFEYCPIHQKVLGSVSGQGTYLGCWPDHLHSGHIHETTNQCFYLFFYLNLCLPLLPSLNLLLSLLL